MPGEIKVENVIKALQGAGASMRCSEMKAHLESLGFTVRDGKKTGHKVFFHDELEGFRSGSYTCNHGRNPELKRPYISNVIKTLNMYKAELIKINGGAKK